MEHFGFPCPIRGSELQRLFVYQLMVVGMSQNVDKIWLHLVYHILAFKTYGNHHMYIYIRIYNHIQSYTIIYNHIQSYTIIYNHIHIYIHIYIYIYNHSLLNFVYLLLAHHGSANPARHPVPSFWDPDFVLSLQPWSYA
jgi:predicted ATPase